MRELQIPRTKTELARKAAFAASPKANPAAGKAAVKQEAAVEEHEQLAAASEEAAAEIEHIKASTEAAFPTTMNAVKVPMHQGFQKRVEPVEAVVHGAPEAGSTVVGGLGLGRSCGECRLITIVSVVVLFLAILESSTSNPPRTVCVNSHSEAIVKWALSISNASNTEDKRRFCKLSTVDNEDINPTWSDYCAVKNDWKCFIMSKFISSCSTVIVILRASDLFSGRNPLQRYTKHAQIFLKHPQATLAIVNATCEDMEGNTARLVDECKLSRSKTFLKFVKSNTNSYLVPTTTKIKDVPKVTSAHEYFDLLFTNMEFEELQQVRNAKTHKDNLKDKGNESPHEACNMNYNMEDEIYTRIEKTFPRFQIALIGKEGVGKSTTARWLAHHLNTEDSLKKSFTSAKKASSFTRTFNMLELTRTLAVTDTMGLPDLSPMYLCDIKRLLDGSLVKANAKSMEWSKNTSGHLLDWLGWHKSCLGSSSSSAQEANPKLQAHVLLLVISYKESTWDEDKEEVEKFVSEIKKSSTPGSQQLADFDLMDRMVFGITGAPQDDIKFQLIVDSWGLSDLDTFRLNLSTPVIEIDYTDTDGPFVSAETYYPILKRLEEKSCKFFTDEIKRAIEKDEIERARSSSGTLENLTILGDPFWKLANIVANISLSF